MANPNIFSLAAIEAGYHDCDEWLKEVNQYINQNETFFCEYINKYMPKFKIMPREGTYLLWINYSSLKISEEELEEWFIEKAKVEVYMGSNFGNDGICYIRVNIATSRVLLQQALDRMIDILYKEDCQIVSNYT